MTLLLLLRRSTKLLRQGPKLLRRPLSYCCWSGGRLLRWSRDLLRSLWKSRKLAGIELELVLSVAPAAAAAAERKAAGAVADEDAPEVGTAGVGAVLNG